MDWPNLFIVGAPRSGTTSLHEYLNQSIEIYMSSLKEPNFFGVENCYSRYLKNIPKNQNEYLKLFDPGKSRKYIGESSTIYLSNEYTPKRIHSKSPNAKIIIILRDPIERAFSHYFHHFQMDFKSIQVTFDEQIKLELERGTDFNEYDIRLEFGLYYQDVKRYIDEFGTQNVKIILFEEFVKNITKTIFEVSEFLNISSFDPQINKIHNPSISPRGVFSNKILHSKIISTLSRYFLPISLRRFLKRRLTLKNRKNQKISSETRNLLKNYYKKDVTELKNYLELNLPWPNFS